MGNEVLEEDKGNTKKDKIKNDQVRDDLKMNEIINFIEQIQLW